MQQRRAPAVASRGGACPLLGFAGVAVLFNPFGFDWSRPEVDLGNGLLMPAAIGGGVAILHIRGRAWLLSPLQLTPWQMLRRSRRCSRSPCGSKEALRSAGPPDCWRS